MHGQIRSPYTRLNLAQRFMWIGLAIGVAGTLGIGASVGNLLFSTGHFDPGLSE